MALVELFGEFRAERTEVHTRVRGTARFTAESGGEPYAGSAAVTRRVRRLLKLPPRVRARALTCAPLLTCAPFRNAGIFLDEREIPPNGIRICLPAPGLKYSRRNRLVRFTLDVVQADRQGDAVALRR